MVRYFERLVLPDLEVAVVVAVQEQPEAVVAVAAVVVLAFSFQCEEKACNGTSAI